ncbi:MAG: phosphoglycerate mutase family protein [Deinococcota bacterium]
MYATLTLIRHARAAERGPDYPNDSLRPLVPKGEQQARDLAQFLKLRNDSFHWLISSPYTRAVQTADPLKSFAKEVTTLGSLATPNYDMLFQDIHTLLTSNVQGLMEPIHLALVGHEPYLGELAAYLLTGDPEGLRLRVKKASLIELTGELAAGKMQLTQLTPYSSYKHSVKR